MGGDIVKRGRAGRNGGERVGNGIEERGGMWRRRYGEIVEEERWGDWWR